MTRKTSFYYSFLSLPAPKRRAITAVFDFCRAIDDAVDLEPDRSRAMQALQMWRDEVDLVFTDRTPRTPQGLALRPFVGPAHLPRAEFDALIDGVAMDAAGVTYHTFADLEPYCHRVASAVGLICAEIFEYHDPAVREYARDLGVALQLTNILRDVAVDYRIGRRYLPDEDLDRCNCTWDHIRVEVERAGGGVASAQVRAVLECMDQRARAYFRRATDALPRQDVRRVLAAEIMRAVYWELLQRIERANYDVFTSVIRVDRPTQARLAIGVWWRTR